MVLVFVLLFFFALIAMGVAKVPADANNITKNGRVCETSHPLLHVIQPSALATIKT